MPVICKLLARPMHGSNSICGARTSLHPARISRQKGLVESNQVIAIHTCTFWIDLVEGAEDRLVSRAAKNEAEVASRCACCEDSLYRGSHVGERLPGALFVLLHTAVPFVLADQSPADVIRNHVTIDVAPEAPQQLLSSCHGPLDGLVLPFIGLGLFP